MCYAVPLVSSIVTSALWHKTKSLKVWWLNLMLAGGALFGLIDHAWNGELFLVSGNIMKDLLLGAVITLGIFAAWLAVLVFGRKTAFLPMDAEKAVAKASFR